MKKRLNQLQTTVDLLNGEKDSLLVKIQAAEKELKTQEGAAAVAIEKLERDCAAFENQIAKLHNDASQIARLQENAEEVKRRLEDTIAQRDSHQQRADAAANRIQVLEDIVEKLKDSAAEGASTSDPALMEEKIQLQNDLAELSNRLKKSQDANTPHCLFMGPHPSPSPFPLHPTPNP